MKNETNKYFERYIDVIPENKTYTDRNGKALFEFTAYVYMTEKKHIRTVLSKLQNERDPEIDVDPKNLQGMDLSTFDPEFKKCLKCGKMDHQTKDCQDLCLRLVLFQPINWAYAEYIKKETGAYKVTTGYNNKGRIVNWGFAHFRGEKERENASAGLKKMFLDGQILEKILKFNTGPPECCYLCGQVSHLANEKRHKQDQCPLRRRPPPKEQITEEKEKRPAVRFAPWAKVAEKRAQTSSPTNTLPKPRSQSSLPERKDSHVPMPISPLTLGQAAPIFEQIPISNSFASLQDLDEQEEEKEEKNSDQKHTNPTGNFQYRAKPTTLARSRSLESLKKKATPKERKTNSRSPSPKSKSSPLFKWTPANIVAWGQNGELETKTNENKNPDQNPLKPLTPIHRKKSQNMNSTVRFH